MAFQDIAKKVYRLKRSLRSNSFSKEARYATYKVSKILSKNWAKGLKTYDTLLGNHRLKMIALDLDGSGLNSKKEFVPENIAAIKELKWKKPETVICIATGRGYHQGLRYAKELDAEFFVTDNGGAIYKRLGNEYKLHRSVYLLNYESEAIYKKIQEYTVENPDLVWHFSTDSIEDNYLIENGKDSLKKAHNTFYPGEEFGAGVTQIKDFKEIKELGLSQRIIKICVDFQKDEIGQKQCRDFEQFLIKNDLNYFQTSDSKLEIAPSGENKGRALLEITKIMKDKGIYISPNEILAIVDSKNDVSMMQIGAIGRGPKNALDNLHPNMIKSKIYDNNDPWIANEAIASFPEKTTRTTLKSIINTVENTPNSARCSLNGWIQKSIKNKLTGSKPEKPSHSHHERE